jgi:hypothetical protein
MNIRHIPWLALALTPLAIVDETSAATVYTDRTAFESVLASYRIEDFESYATAGTPDPLLNIPDGLASPGAE